MDIELLENFVEDRFRIRAITYIYNSSLSAVTNKFGTILSSVAASKIAVLV